MNVKLNSSIDWTAVFQILIILMLYMVISIFVIDYSSKIQVSLAFYVQIVIVLVFSLPTTNNRTYLIETQTKDYSFIKDCLWIAMCLWFTIFEVFISESKPSYWSAFLLVVSIATSVKTYLRVLAPVIESKEMNFKVRALIGVFQLIILSQVIMFLMVLFNGQWNWKFFGPFELIDYFNN